MSKALLKRRTAEGKNTIAPIEWTNTVATQGETMVACIMYSRTSDNFFGQWLLLNVPFRHPDDLWDERANYVPKNLKFLALCLLKKPEYWRVSNLVKLHLELEAHPDYMIENQLNSLRAKIELTDAYLLGERNVEDDPDPILPGQKLAGQLRLFEEQTLVIDTIQKSVKIALARRWPEEADADEWAAWLATRENDDRERAFAVLGPAGSGKTTAVEIAIEQAVALGAHVGIACPTGFLASKYREKFPQLDVDTVHGMFLLHKHEMTTLEVMSEYDLVVIDEVGQLSQTQFERIMRLWDAAFNRPALVFVGDFHQLRSIEGTTAAHSWRWQKDVHVRKLFTMRRCECEELKWKLELLRTAMPSQRQLRSIIKKHRAPSRSHRKRPGPEDIVQILKETPETVFTTYSKSKAEEVNSMVVQALFKGLRPIALIPGDPRDVAKNFKAGEMVNVESSWIPIYEGLRLTLTENLDKQHGFVNGMGCEVVKVRKNGIEVKTDLKTSIMLHPITRDFVVSGGESRRVRFYPARLGYAVNLHKVQGQTMKHITIWLDKAGVPAAAYVALSRVRKDAHWRFVGVLTPAHFTPAMVG